MCIRVLLHEEQVLQTKLANFKKLGDIFVSELDQVVFRELSVSNVSEQLFERLNVSRLNY